MLGGIQNALAALLGKMFVGKAVGQMKAEKKGKEGEGELAPNSKGAPVGDEGELLLFGVGYGVRDKHTKLKNLIEQENAKSFLDAHQDGVDRKDEPKLLRELKDPGKGGDAETEAADSRDPQELREAKDQDVRREEARDEARIQGRKETKEPDKKENADAKEPERQQQEQRDDEDKPGGGWVMEEDEAEETDQKRGLREAGVLTDQNRCKGTLEDGSRCLRKPVKGLGYCREHTIGWRPDTPPKA